MSRFNWFNVVLLVLVAAGIYAAVKFVPPAWTKYKVDEVLTDIAFQAIKLRTLDPSSRHDREQKLVDDAHERIVALGIGADRLNVYFDPDMSAVHAEYSVVVEHPVVRPTVLEYSRAIGVPGDSVTP